MATTKALTHRGARYWDQRAQKAPSDLPQILLAVALWVVLLAAIVLLVAAGVSWVFTTFANSAYLQGQGVGAALPLGTLAAFMSFSWLPALMPLLLPFVAVVLLVMLPFSPPARAGYARLRRAWGI
jgi:hypothetical protein